MTDTGDFAECRCPRCNAIVQAEDLREVLGSQWLQNIREEQMKTMLAQAEGMTKCPNCSEVFAFEPSAPNYQAKDDTGKTLSREAAEHMANNRVRCWKCAKNFCTKCNKEPYHLGMTCEDAEKHRVALKCRFCWEPLKEG